MSSHDAQGFSASVGPAPPHRADAIRDADGAIAGRAIYPDGDGDRIF